MAEISVKPPRSIAGIASFHDRGRLLAALQVEFGAPIPSRPGFLQAGEITLACLGTARFLAIAPADADLPARLARTLHGLAAVTNQTDMWTTWLVSGTDARDCLARIVPIDLAPGIFQIGDLALTRAGHLDVRICRVAPDTYEIAVTRSTADDLLHHLRHASQNN